MSESVECVQVVVRCRPLNQKEIDRGCRSVVSVDESSGEVITGSSDNPGKSSSNDEPSFCSTTKKQESSQFPSKMFTFDRAFGEKSHQKDIYEQTARDIIKSVMDGYNGTIFAYGQTGTGKTYTMVGEDGNFDEETSNQGIIPRAFHHIFNEIESHKMDGCNGGNSDYLVRCSFIEIYNDLIKDLLNQKSPNNVSDFDARSLELREHPEKGVYVKDLQCMEVESAQQLLRYFQRGNNFRHVAETAMNRDSSRSHSVFTIIVESVIPDVVDANKENIRVGKLHLVDLAGSERQSKTEAKGMRFTEAININLSLSALGNVINSLTSNSKSKHIPYRDSKLTRILQDSLGGNSKTVMIANICSSDYNYEETLSTLRFANRAKHIQNKPHINQDPKDKLLEEYKQQIEELRQRLANQQQHGDGAGGRGVAVDEEMEEQIIPKIVIQKVHKIGMSKERVRRMYESQQKEENALKQRFEKEKQLWKRETKDYLTRKIKTEKKVRYIEEEVLLKKQQKKENLRRKLQDIEQKLVDGERMIHCANKQHQELQSKKEMLAEIKAKEEALRRDYQQKQQKHLLLKEQYDSHEQELRDKKTKLVKLYEKYKQLSYDIESLQSSFQNKREEYLNIIRILNKKIQLKNTIIEYFVEPNALQKLYQSERIVLEDGVDIDRSEEGDEDESEEKEMERLYTIRKLDLRHLSTTLRRPVSCKQQRGNSSNNAMNKVKRIQPVTEWNRIQCVLLQNENPRYRYENILQLSLDMPQRTTQDYYELYDE